MHLFVVYGSSGHGKVVCDVLRAAGMSVEGFVDDGAGRVGTTVMGLPVLGTGAWLSGRDVRVALGIGDNGARERVAARCLDSGARLVTGIHPSAVVAETATIAEGTMVMAQAVVNPDARVGRGVIVNTGAVVEHDCVVGDFAHVSPRSVMGGACRVGAFAQLGIGATMLPATSIGEGSLVGAGAVVVRDLPAGVIARGVPARAVRERR